jgi:monovalent cation/proton antiporter MnhG/PhaG subunit
VDVIAVWVVRILLWAGIVAVVTGSLGILFARTVFDRLHYAGLVSSVGTVGVAAAVAIHEGWSQAGIKCALIGLLILFANPVLTHATARAARVRRYGKLMPEPQERVRFLDQPGYVGEDETRRVGHERRNPAEHVEEEDQ